MHQKMLSDLVTAAAAAWPGVRLPPAVFHSYLTARLGEELEPPPSAEVAAALWLACACARGDAAALRAFDSTYLPHLARVVARTRLPADQVDDVIQELRHKLLVARPDGRPPRITEYGGRGDFGGWLRVTATREALKKIRGRRPGEGSVEAEDALLAARAAGDDPELSYLKELYRGVFRQSFAAALGSLDAREKNLLRQHFVDGLSIDDLAPMYDVHRATCARWIQRAREHLWDETRRQFMTRAKVGARECESVLRLVQSKLQITLGPLLARSAPSGDVSS
jgi:RNA polymerase sigma-70 factor (ECF subfamily)